MDSPRSALVTGGSTGLGLATARRLADLGLGVTVTGRTASTLGAAVDDLRSTGADVTGVVADAAAWPDNERAVADHVAHHGGLDVVVANAGFTAAGDLSDGDPDQWRDMVLTNVLGPALLVRAALPHLTAPGGQIVLWAAWPAGSSDPGASTAPPRPRSRPRPRTSGPS